ncbi:DUF1963 domain-containing protein [Deinococcus sp. A31D244]|uniref:DUF1963 domain-containing protein n=1 Tax=Deinococcus sp. A31D244 TaxID=3397675 RepID=UPI0039E1F322
MQRSLAARQRDARILAEANKSIREFTSIVRRGIEQGVQAATGSSEPSVLARAAILSLELFHANLSPEVQSHQGGRPHGVTRWPEHDGRPQLFLLAIRLSELKEFQREDLLPPEGWLNFFMAPEVMTGEAPLTACAVVFTPDEAAPTLAAPAGSATAQPVGLEWSTHAHHIPLAHEFSTPDEYEAAATELKALRVLNPFPQTHITTDYLLGKQWYANPLHLRTDQDVATFTREQHGREDTRLQSLLTLTSLSRHWSFFEGTRVLSVTFLIEASDLQARRFDRVIVDVTSL